jgi:plasmid stabilization system protein ParE
MNQLTVSPEAEDDVFQIWRYLFREAGLTIANRVESEILAEFATLAKTPEKGHRRSDLTRHDVLFCTVYQYMIVYRQAPVEVLAVLHGRRNMKRLLKKRL